MMNFCAGDAVHAADLRVRRGGRRVLDRLTFSLPRGAVTGLLGPSGCGKSTCMRAIVGVQADVAGTLRVLDRPAGDAALRGRVRYVTQAPSVYDDLTVRQNLRYFAAILGVRGRARGETADRALAQVDLADHAGTLAGRLSGGQHSRVSLAAALLDGGRDGTQPPELLILDEPTVGLDPVLRQQLWDLFHQRAADGSTVLVSSHVMDEAERCERLLLLRDGQLLADTEPERLRRDSGADTVEQAFLRLVEEAATPHSAADPSADTAGDIPSSRPAAPRPNERG